MTSHPLFKIFWCFTSAKEACKERGGSESVRVMGRVSVSVNESPVVSSEFGKALLNVYACAHLLCTG